MRLAVVCSEMQSANGFNRLLYDSRDIASGSKRITEVNEAFHSSAETLEQQAKTYGVRATPPHASLPLAYGLWLQGVTSFTFACIYRLPITAYTWCHLICLVLMRILIKPRKAHLGGHVHVIHCVIVLLQTHLKQLAEASR